MNIGVSINICLAQRSMGRKELAQKIEVTPTYICKLCNKTICSASMLDRLATVFELKVSEFVALGE